MKTYDSNKEPAFPGIRKIRSTGDPSYSVGMHLRDFFAVHAPPMPDQWLDSKAEGYYVVADADAAWRYCYADAMLRVRDLEARKRPELPGVLQELQNAVRTFVESQEYAVVIGNAVMGTRICRYCRNHAGEPHKEDCPMAALKKALDA